VSAEQREDRELLAAHVAGDPKAFSELVRRHRDRLWGVALRTLGDPEDAADAVQDGLLSAYRRAETFRGDAAVSTWLHRIVVNACLDLARRRASRPTVALGDRDVPAPRNGTESSDAALVVTAALRRLRPDQAAALVLVDLEEFSVADAAAILEVPEGTVKSRCARARARLAEILTEPGNAPGTAAVQSSGTVGRDEQEGEQR